MVDDGRSVMRALEPVTVGLPGYNISQPLPKKGINTKGKWKCDLSTTELHYRAFCFQGMKYF